MRIKLTLSAAWGVIHKKGAHIFMLKKLIHYILSKNEKRLGLKFDYAHKVADEDIGLFLRYTKIFSFLDPNKHVPKKAYHAARICGAITADCGTCVEAEINLAKNAGLDAELISNILTQKHSELPVEISDVVKLSIAVTNFHDDQDAREKIVRKFGEKGLIELAYAMNGAALLPGIKRAMGYATSCNLDVLRARASILEIETDNNTVQPIADTPAD